MPTNPPAIFVPTSGGAAPTAPGGIFVPTSGGAAPTAPGAVFVPVAGGAAPTAPGAVFVPVASGAVLPNTYLTNFPFTNNDMLFTQLDAGAPPTVQFVFNSFAAPDTVTVTGRAVLFNLYTNFGLWLQKPFDIYSLIAFSPAVSAMLFAQDGPLSDGLSTLCAPTGVARPLGPVALAGGTVKLPPPALFTPAGSGGAVTAPASIFTPAGSGGAVTLPPTIFTPAASGGAVTAPPAVFIPA
jgi:hypothetical protein